MKHKVRVYHSEILDELFEKMKNDPWYVKLGRWYKIKRWLFICNTRFLWDKSYSGYIFKKKTKKP